MPQLWTYIYREKQTYNRREISGEKEKRETLHKLSSLPRRIGRKHNREEKMRFRQNSFEQLEKVEDMVRHHFRDDPHCRDSTTHLYFLVLKECYEATNPKGKRCEEAAFLSDLYDLLVYSPCDETVQRSRRKVQNTYKEYMPSKKVKEMRDTRQEDISNWSRY